MTGPRPPVGLARPLSGHRLSTPMTADRVHSSGHDRMPTGHRLVTGHTPLTEGVRT